MCGVGGGVKRELGIQVLQTGKTAVRNTLHIGILSCVLIDTTLLFFRFHDTDTIFSSSYICVLKSKRNTGI